MPQPDPQPDPQPFSHLAAILADEPLVQSIIQGIISGEVEAKSRWNVRRPRTWRGTEAYFQNLEYLELGVVPLGWEREDFHNQRRFLSPPGLYPYRIRLLLARGRRDNMQVLVNPKGTLTRILIEHENALFGPQLSLFGANDTKQWQNAWIISEVDRDDRLTGYLAFPWSLSECRKVLECLECHWLFTCDLNTVISQPQELPQSQPIEFPDLEERDDADGEGKDGTND